MDIIKALLERHDLKILNPSCNGDTPLALAIDLGLKDAVKLLIDEGADVNYVENSLHQTPLMMAVNKNDDTIIDMLLKHKLININAQTAIGTTAFSLACEK
jgi:ankyrin repeat protein